MPKLYIVIAAQYVKKDGDNVALLYDDTTEKFIEDPDNVSGNDLPPSVLYKNFLEEKYINQPDYIVIRQEIDVVKSIDVKKLISSEAKNKLTEAELSTLFEEFTLINNNNND